MYPDAFLEKVFPEPPQKSWERPVELFDQGEEWVLALLSGHFYNTRNMDIRS